MSSFQDQTIASTSNQLTLTEEESFVFVSGLAGSSIRATYKNYEENPWWDSVYTLDENANYGALFCSFDANDTANTAECYFKDIDGNIPDSFTLISALNH